MVILQVSSYGEVVQAGPYIIDTGPGSSEVLLGSINKMEDEERTHSWIVSTGEIHLEWENEWNVSCDGDILMSIRLNKDCSR